MKKLKKIICWCLSLFICLYLPAQNIPEQPNPPRLVNDFANFLSPNEVDLLENQLVVLSQNTQKEIAIVTLDEIGDYDISDFANQLGRKWKIGDQKTNSGLLILIVKKKRKAFISTGYGVEGILPDVTCRKIIQETIKPYFAEQQFYQGLQNAIFRVVTLYAENNQDPQLKDFYAQFLSGQQVKTKHLSQKKSMSLGQIVFMIIGIIIFLLISISSRGRRGGGGFFIGSGFGGGGFSSHQNDFGGFGGGSFGGGGAGGDW